MNEAKYKKLNDYLNGIFKELEVNDWFLIKNIEAISRMSDAYLDLTSKYDFSREMPKENNLTFEDIYLLGREIIESIDPNYLSYYDDVLKSGVLDFDYENKYEDSYYVYYELKSGIREINVKRKFNYLDVVVIIHEFMHYINSLGRCHSINRYLLTEFISIYFGEYAKRYLIDKGIEKDDLFLNERIFFSKKDSQYFSKYDLIILAYEKLGKIDEKTYIFLEENYCKVSKEQFEKECIHLLTKLEKEEEKYRYETMYEAKFDESKLFYRLTGLVNSHYRYILGTILAYHALKYCKMEKIVYLNNHINDEEYINMSLSQVLQTIDIDLNDLNLDVIEEQIIKNNTGQKKY